MFWRLGVFVVAAMCVTSLAHADEQATAAKPDEIASQEIGVLLGAAMGGGVSPGGLALDGRYLYRLSELDWFEAGTSFSLGSGAAACFNDRQSTLVCKHGLVDGFSAELRGGIRRYFSGQQQFRPYLRGSLGLRLVSFSGDNLRGVTLPLALAAGVRVDVANRVLVVVESSVRAGPAFLGRNLGIRADLSLAITAGVEFTL